MKLLVVEDDPPLQAALLRLLAQWGYAIEQASTAAEALGLPDRDGLSLCRQLRRLSHHQPLVLMLTARDGRADKLRGFEQGADDYVVNPFDPELLRLRALLRRAQRPFQPELAFCPLRLVSGQTSVLVRGEPLELTRKGELLHGIGDGCRTAYGVGYRLHPTVSG